jgi:hypothetical protein
MSEPLKKLGPFTLVHDVAYWRHWWSLRWTTLAAVFSAMGGVASAHTPWWFVPVCAGAAVMCNAASGTARVIQQKPKDGNPPVNN